MCDFGAEIYNIKKKSISAYWNQVVPAITPHSLLFAFYFIDKYRYPFISVEHVKVHLKIIAIIFCHIYG